MPIVMPSGEVVATTPTALQDASLTLNGLNLMMSAPDPVHGYLITPLGDDAEFGNPEAVIAAIASQLQDGDLERIDRYGNREASIPLILQAPDSQTPGDALAKAAAVIDAACRFDEWTELAYTSPLAAAETSVYEVTSATVSATFDEMAELIDGCRYVTLRIHARPFPRPVDMIDIDAPAVIGSTTTPVDDGSSATGWSMLSTAPAPIKNLLANPSFESGTTSWSASSNTSSVAQASAGDSGTKSLIAFSTSGPGQFLNRSYVQGPACTVVPTKVYRVGGSIMQTGSSSDIDQIGTLTKFYNGSGGQLGGDNDAVTAPGALGSWKRWKVSRTAPAGAATLRPFPFARGNGNVGAISWYFDRGFVIEVTEENPDPDFFDGNTADTTAITYTWDGIANNSTSTGTWTAPTLAPVGGAVKGTVYGRASASIRRSGAVSMSSAPYMRIKGTASAYSDGLVTVADNGGGAIDPTSYSYNPTTGAFDILIYRPDGFTAVDVTFARTGGTVSKTDGLFVAVDSIDITNNPFASGKVQTRQVTIYGSQRTELASLTVLGLDAAGTTPQGLGGQVLVHTAAKGQDGRAKFLACRAASGLAPTGSATDATSGSYNTLGATSSPTAFTFPASTLLNGNYMVVALLRSATVGTSTLSFRALVDPTVGDNVYDPPTGWKTAPLKVVDTGAVWPQVNNDGDWVMVPLGLLKLPPADIEDPGATITIQLAKGANNVDVDDVFLLNADVGQASILLTGLASGSYSAVRLDGATVDHAQASAWFGAANGTMLADATRWVSDGEQHAAAPGLLQISVVTPGCATPRVSVRYAPRNHTHVTSLGAA